MLVLSSRCAALAQRLFAVNMDSAAARCGRGSRLVKVGRAPDVRRGQSAERQLLRGRESVVPRDVVVVAGYRLLQVSFTEAEVPSHHTP